ncbi:MAG TPA: hypothetical protein VLJ16_03555 [Acidobacteriota bacterium]|nr:hypothetical protein [Acidobacteriota bacterium]
MNRRRWAIAAAALLLVGALLGAGRPAAGGQAAPATGLKPAGAEPGTENPAAARPVRERMAVLVILGWVWVSIAVLLGVLRLRVREADRVHRMGLDRTGEGYAKGQRH